jgi:hypothetical protein
MNAFTNRRQIKDFPMSRYINIYFFGMTKIEVT